MKTISKVLVTAAIAASLSTPVYADYPSEVADKFGRGLSNGALGWAEFAKNAYNEPAHNGPLYIPVGLLKGVAHAVGRTVTGVFDLATFLIPTASLVQPARIWESTDTETSYGMK